MDLVASTLKGSDARVTSKALGRDSPPELDKICVRATALAPADRFQSARELHLAIERFLDGDRDLELRRELAARHASAAAESAERVRGQDSPEHEERRRALREVGQALALGIGAIAASIAQSRSRHPSPILGYVLLALSTLAVVTTSRIFGPFMLLPCLAIVNTIGFVITPHPLARVAFIACGCASIAIPALLEWAGVWQPSYLFHDGLMTVTPQMHGLEGTPTMVFLLLANVAILLGSALAIGRIRDALTDAETRLQLHAWQLRQLIPEETGAAPGGAREAQEVYRARPR
jgi:hypothetical protein